MAAERRPDGVVPFVVPAAMKDEAEALEPADVRLMGFLGARVQANEANRLAQVDLEPLLAGFRHRPGSHPWIGEHIGKWMHAATLAWANSGDEALRKKLDYAAAELIKTQEPDGYLGTYTPDRRFGLFDGADWDVWSHKYCLIGLLTYYRYTGSAEALDACRRMGDLLDSTFGPRGRSIVTAGTHRGMAATSVLEPIVLLYRCTGEKRYLALAERIVRSYDDKDGPRVVSTLTQTGMVSRTADGKAYEMLSNLVGLCELARVTGEERYLVPAIKAWDDVVKNHLYITGTASFGEVFHSPHELPNGMGAAVGETCVTVTWMQLSHQLLRLMGEARYAEELERSLYNHLAGAQRPDGKEWCYYTALEGKKEYGPGISCCVSSGPRGMAMAPGMVYSRGTGPDRVMVSLFEPSHAVMMLGGKRVTVEQETAVPVRGGAVLTFRMKNPARFGVMVRVPAWAPGIHVKEHPGARADGRGWLVIPAREWKDGEAVHIEFEIRARMVPGEFGNQGKAALAWGPLVLAYDSDRNREAPLGACAALGDADPGEGGRAMVENDRSMALSFPIISGVRREKREAVFVTFAEAGSAGGAGGGMYRVWIGAPGSAAPCSLLADGKESRSTEGNVAGSIIDGELDTFVVTWDGTRHEDEWFEVSVRAPVTFRRVVYAHGRAFHDGGWFDASDGRPRVEVRRSAGAPWEVIGELTDYPATNARDAKGLKTGQQFTLSLKEPVTAVAVRVRGAGACGDTPAQCFSSCGELGAHGD